MQLQKQASSIEKLLKTALQELTKPVKFSYRSSSESLSYQITMQSTAFLARENELLRARNKKIEQKGAHSKLQLAATENSSVAKIRQLAQNSRNAQFQPSIDQPTGQAEAQERSREPPKCSECGIKGHK